MKFKSEPFIVKKQRTKTSRRLRQKISPVLISPSNSFSCDSSKITVETNVKKRKLQETRNDTQNDLSFRRITRSYYKQQQSQSQGQSEKKIDEIEVSEISCVESNSGADFKKLNNDVVSTTSEASFIKTEQISKNENVSIEESSFVVDSKSKSVSEVTETDDLACGENFAYNDVVSEEYSSHDNTGGFSELQFEVFHDVLSSLDGCDCFSSEEYSPSIFFDSSGSEFSQKTSNDSPPSHTFCLLLEFRKQFFRSSVCLGTSKSDSRSFVRFKNEEDEESYLRLRERERRQLYLHDYVELYRYTTEFGQVISQQRSQMVHWIVEQASAKNLEQETMFLGVSLLDRFLSKGFFKSLKNLQILGIACLTLATRIEENQPYNSVRKRNFTIESNTYSRAEVVAMEWLVQEVLNFQCLLPTVQNFMWFYLKAAKADPEMERTARYLATLVLPVTEHLRYWPSTVAAGLVILASLKSAQLESYQRVIEVHIRTKDNDLHVCIKALEWLIEYVN